MQINDFRLLSFVFYQIILEAVVACTTGTQLFTATCDSAGFKILINEVS